MLYRPDAFEPLTDESWQPAKVRDAIATIVTDAESAYSPETFWPADDWDGWKTPLPLKSLYVGAAGVVWALHGLRQRGHGDGRLDLVQASHAALAAWRAEPDFMEGLELPSTPASSLLCGETGLLLVAWTLEQDPTLADSLLERVRENRANEAWEVMWGSSGTMLAARTLFEATREDRWREAWRDSADTLLAARDADGLWTGRLFGFERRSLTPPHGLVGNVGELLAGGSLLDDETRREVMETTRSILAATAVREDRLASWPTRHGGDLVGPDDEIRLQWCGGAPGMVIATADYLDEELLLAGAELTWRAGPHGVEKGPSICHGTAGNGYAFLKVWQRTGDERWLGRARRFAVHALGQVERLRADRTRGRYSLWTGDVGVALFAADCLDERSAYPVLDAWGW